MNNVSGSYSYEAPPNFQGGLLADDMGLGKTLSMICLIAANQACNSLPSPPITPEPLDTTSSLVVNTTLLIVPPARKYSKIVATLALRKLIHGSYTSMAKTVPVVSPRARAHKSSFIMLLGASLDMAILMACRHLQPGSLKCHTYHGQKRNGVEFLGQFDVVITTYHTISHIWRKYTEDPEKAESIFSLMWYRVVLDEGE
jgi:SNF2 family DNA or RNA helicase